MMVHVYMCKCMYVCAFMQMCNSTVKNMRLFNYAISYYTCYNSCSLSFKIALYDASYCVVVYVYQWLFFFSDEIIILNLIAAGKKEDTHWTAGEPSWHQCQQRLRQTQSLMHGRMEHPLHLTKRAKQALQYQFKYRWTTMNSSYTSVDLLFCLKESITSPFLYCSSITTVWSERLILCDVCVCMCECTIHSF